jgi:hypothetical protein
MAAVENNDEDAIPELIQDTLPDLAILAPELAKSADYGQTAEPAAPALPDALELPGDDIPTLSSSDEPTVPAGSAIAIDPELAAALEAAQVGTSEEELPEWERDPTLAELQPDLDALEHAMAVAQGLAPDTDSDEETAPGDGSGETDEPVPAITLDREIQAKIDEAAELLKQAELEAEERAKSEADDSSKPDNRSTSEILAEANRKPEAPSVEAQFNATEIPVAPAVAAPTPKIAETPAAPVPSPAAPPPATPQPTEVVEKEVAAAKSPVAAPPKPPPMPNPELREIAANISRAKTINDVDDQMAETLFGEEFSLIAAQIAANAPRELSANDEVELAMEDAVSMPAADFESAAAVEIDLEAQPKTPSGGIDLSETQQRLATVRALNAAPPPAGSAPENIVIIEDPVAAMASTDDHPESIEEQINTSITQTLEALNVRPAATAAVDDDEEEEEGKSGFFSRFRRS